MCHVMIEKPTALSAHHTAFPAMLITKDTEQSRLRSGAKCISNLYLHKMYRWSESKNCKTSTRQKWCITSWSKARTFILNPCLSVYIIPIHVITSHTCTCMYWHFHALNPMLCEFMLLEETHGKIVLWCCFHTPTPYISLFRFVL